MPGVGVGVYAIHDYGGFDPYFLMAVLNSRFLTHYLNVKFKDKHLAGGYLAINKSTIEQLPLVEASPEAQLEISKIAQQILSAKELDPTADVSAAQQAIDLKVYALYGLSDSERTEIESLG